MAREHEHQVIVSTRAKDMMVSHAAFLARVSPDAALRLADEFEAAVGSLSAMPQRCPHFNGPYIPKDIYRYLVLQKRYLIIYQVRDNTVLVDYVADGRQEYTWYIP